LVYWEPPILVMLTFLVFVVARYMQWGARRDIFATLRIEFVLGLALAVACSMMLPSAPLDLGRNRYAKRVVVGIALLFFAMIIQIPFAADKTLAQSIFIDRVIKFAMLTFFMVVLIRSPNNLRYFLAAFLFACFYVTQEAARGALSGSLIWENQGIPRLHGAVPIYRHPNSLAGVAMGIIPFGVFLFPAVKRLYLRLLLLAPMGTASICLLYSGSRTGYVAFISFIVFWWSQSRHKIRSFAIIAAVFMVALPILPEEYVGRFKSIGGVEAEGRSKQKRIEILKDAVVIFGENPLGVGVASFPAVRTERFGRSQDTHNLYLEVATNLGAQGLVVFIFLIASIAAALLAARRALRRQRRFLSEYLKEANVAGRRVEKRFQDHLDDVFYLESTCTAVLGFLFVRLILGLFGMDLYEPYWWFVGGGAIVCSLMTSGLGAVTRELGRGSG
jgi:O-antigen ligase